MKQTSLRFRLTVLSFASIALALIVTTYALNARFYSYFEERINLELAQHLEQLATNLTLTDSGVIEVAPLSDRRFDQPFSGLYWQVSIAGNTDHLSRSLWGNPFDLPEGLETGERFFIHEKSPTGVPVLASGWAIAVGTAETEQKVILAVATDEAVVLDATREFRLFLIKWLALMMFGLITAAWLQINVGLAPLKLIKSKVEEVKNGTQRRLTGHYPTEVTPLVEEVNTLLAAHEQSLESARAKASELAHGLKTPLTVIRALSSEIQNEIEPQKIRAIEDQISAMNEFIERELAQARKDSAARASLLAPNLKKMVESMQKLPRGSDLSWVVDAPSDLTIPLDSHDLAELLGNILDNARKWAKRKVVIRTGTNNNNASWLLVEDDGNGVSTAMLDKIGTRGTSIQSEEPGNGLGLSISTDLMRNIHGTIELTKSNLGGLKVRLCWESPAAPS